MLNVLSAASTAGAAPSLLGSYGGIIPMIGMVAIFWFLIIRPQMKRQKEHQRKIQSMKRGDQVVTGGGFVGKVVKVDDVYVEIELAQGVKVKAVKNTITDLLTPGGTPAND